MGNIHKLQIPILTLLSLIAVNGFSQSTASNSELINAAREIISSAPTCALITIDEEGKPSVRAMETLPLEDNFTIWFGTNPKSRKVAQIKQDARVTLYYLDSDASGYVTIHGIAKIIDNKKAKEAHWKEEWSAFYPNKEKGYVLIKVTPKSIEVISNSRGIAGDSITWEVPEVVFENK